MNQQHKKPIKVRAQLSVNRTTNKPSIVTTTTTAKAPSAAKTLQPIRTLQAKLKPSLPTNKLTSQTLLRQQSISPSSCCSSSSISESTTTSIQHQYPNNQHQTQNPHQNDTNHPRAHQLTPKHHSPLPDIHLPNLQPKHLTPSTSTTPNPPTEFHDSARINRKILDLEISNASLLAINGALERTKVKQQNEIRTLKGRLMGMSEPSEGSDESGTSAASTLPVGEHHPLSAKDVEQEEGKLGMEQLMAQDAQFAELVKAIDTLILSANRAIHHSPSISPQPPPHPPPLASPAAAFPGHPSFANHHLKTKVLNPVEIEEKMLRASLDHRLLTRDHQD